jgi:hypothetical protein
MLVTNHVLSGAVIGAVTRRPAPAFAVGVISHFALDAAPHWGKWANHGVFLRVAVADGLAGLTVAGVMVALAPADIRMAVLAGMAGAALPDADKPAVLFFGGSPFPRLVDDFHKRIQHEERHRFPHEAAVGLVFLAAALALLRRPLRRTAASPTAAGGQLDLVSTTSGS